MDAVAHGTCIGLRFRSYSDFFKTPTGFEERRGFRLLKRQSCTGCQDCFNIQDHVVEVLSEYDVLPIKNNEDIDTFKDYSVSVTGCDGEDIEFFPLRDRIYK